jgi:hypothetical protein
MAMARRHAPSAFTSDDAGLFYVLNAKDKPQARKRFSVNSFPSHSRFRGVDQLLIFAWMEGGRQG